MKVDVFRNQARGNPLPTFFGRLAGVTNQGVRRDGDGAGRDRDSPLPEAVGRPRIAGMNLDREGPAAAADVDVRQVLDRAGQQPAARRRTSIFRRREGGDRL